VAGSACASWRSRICSKHKHALSLRRYRVRIFYYRLRNATARACGALAERLEEISRRLKVCMDCGAVIFYEEPREPCRSQNGYSKR
jgi:hypothetical protein